MSVGLEDIPDSVMELLSQSQSECSDQDPDFLPYSSSPEDISSSFKSVNSEVNNYCVCFNYFWSKQSRNAAQFEFQ